MINYQPKFILNDIIIKIMCYTFKQLIIKQSRTFKSITTFLSSYLVVIISKQELVQ